MNIKSHLKKSLLVKEFNFRHMVTAQVETKESTWDYRYPFKNYDAVDIEIEPGKTKRVPVYFDVPYKVEDDKYIKSLIGDAPFKETFQNYPDKEKTSDNLWYNKNKNKLDEIKAITLVRDAKASLILKIDWCSQWHDTGYYTIWRASSESTQEDYIREIGTRAAMIIQNSKATFHEGFIKHNIEKWSKMISFYSEAIRVNNAILNDGYPDFYNYFWWENKIKNEETGEKEFI